MNSLPSKKRLVPSGSALRIALIYGAFGIAWILLSDWLVRLIAPDMEVYDTLQSLKGLLFVGLSAGLILILARREGRRTDAALTALDADRTRLTGILEGTRAGTWEWHVPSGRTAFNERWAEMIGYSLDELAPVSIKTWSQHMHPDDLRQANNVLQRHFDGKLDFYECEYRMRHKDGHWVWVLDRGRLLGRTSDGKPDLMLGIHLDITDRKRIETEMRRISRLYATLSETNQAIVRVATRDALFQNICDIAVEYGEFSLAWIGVPDPDRQRIEVAAASGPADYLTGLDISIATTPSAEHGPTARAYLSGQRQIVNDFAHDPVTAPWHQRAAQFNIRASAAFPLRCSAQVFGVLNIYAGEKGFFQRQEIKLLEEMAVDIGFGVETLERGINLARSETQFHAIADSISDAIVITNRQREIEWLNAGFTRMFGYTLDELTGQTTEILYEDSDEYRRQGTLHYNEQARSDEERFEVRYRRRNGGIFIGETLGALLQSNTGEPLGYMGLIRDVTREREIEAELRVAAAAFEVENGIMITDHKLAIERVNQAFTRITGYALEDVKGKTPKLLHSGRHTKSFYQRMWQDIHNLGYWEGEIWNRRRDGEIYPEWLTISGVKNDAGAVTHYIGSFSDITDRKAAEQHIHQLAFYDPLTHLANRRLFIDHLEHARSSSERTQQYGAILMLDLDHFKVLNDTQGHHAGDQLLIEVGRRLREHLREADTVARFGGDEFVVLLEDLSQSNDGAINAVSEISEKIRIELLMPYRLETIYDYRSTASLGVVVFRGHTVSTEELLKQADVALYEAKAAGRNAIRFFSPEMQSKVDRRAHLEAELSRALELDEFLLHYQPQVNGRGQLVGAEALLRWRPQSADELVSPAEFIPLAEDTGQIVPIGYRVLELACRQLQIWQQRNPQHAFKLAVNISARQFHQPGFIQRVQQIIDQTRIDPGGLKLELTESVILTDVDYVVDRLREFRELGIGFALDDFGTGYSSLSYLKQLPIEELKIDTSFVRDVVHSEHDAAIVRAIIAMGHSLGLTIIAEGVEAEEQKAYLVRYDCDLYQGYLFGRPMPLAEFEAKFTELASD
ncbi:MAG: EAL domain-containing protein [Gammaproteobacteria bacterium]